ncbi:MAG: carboxyl transferase domain-containing protein, partial [Dehalococcoidia bacterium]
PPPPPPPRPPPPPAAAAPPAPGPVRAGARVDAGDPLAVLAHGKSGASAPQPSAAAALASPPAPPHAEAPAGTVAVTSPMQGTIVGIDVAEGDLVRAGQQVLVMEAMKMEHVVAATTSGEVRQVAVAAGDTVYGGTPLIFVEERAVAADAGADEEAIDLDAIRPDLAAVHARHAAMLDAARGQAVEKRHAGGHRTARENIEDLCDPGSFVEYGGLALTANTQRSLEDLIRLNPGDGMVCGIGMVNGDRFADPANRVTVISYDYMVLAGTQGGINHRKTDRTLQVAEEGRTPVVFFTEGGGGRAGGGSGGNAGARDSGTIVGGGGGGLDTPTFRSMGKLSGLVPTVGITTGYCFAGNAALLGVCDVVIATAGSNIGMGGPAMIEGGGLGVFRPDEVGPLDVQVANGVVDIAVADEAEAVRVTKQYLSYFQGAVHDWECADQRLLRRVIPENRLRVYDMRALIETMADTGSVLELRRGFGLGMVTSLIRMEGRPLGVIANNPTHLSGAIDSDAADKASRFMQLCDAFDLPILFLCDTPGIMVGPEAEKTATVRHAARMFVNGAAVTVPVVTLVVRKAYGLGAQTMGAGHFKNPLLTVAWPTGEFGGMGLEGQVKLGYRVELEALADAEARRHRYDELVARAYERGKALNAAVSFALDDVIDPADSRRVVTGALHAVRPRPRSGRKRMIDTW